MHVGAYITCASVHEENVRRRAEHAGFVYPLARPCVISHGSILSTGTQFSRARCSFEFRFPAFARPSCTPISQFLSHSWLPSLSPLSLSLSLSPFDPCDSFISSHSRVCYFVYFSLVPFRQPIQRMNNPLRFPRLHGFRNRRT